MRNITASDLQRPDIREKADRLKQLREELRAFVGEISDLLWDRWRAGRRTARRAAAQKLIGLLIEHGAVIYYSGDLDPDGIGIADRLWQRYGNNICLWRMSPEDYRKAGSDKKIGEAGIAKLRQICHPELRRVAGYMEKLRVAGYQENILPELVEDMEIND